MNKSWCTLPILGLIITACYLLGATWLLFDRVEQLKTMPLNEIGDFLAGIFGALAFFWLVIGYFMQNSELKTNNKTLISQQLDNKESFRLVRAQIEVQKNIEENRVRERDDLVRPIFEIIPINDNSNIQAFCISAENFISSLDVSIELKVYKNKIFNFKIYNQYSKCKGEKKYTLMEVDINKARKIEISLNEEALSALRFKREVKIPFIYEDLNGKKHQNNIVINIHPFDFSYTIPSGVPLKYVMELEKQ